MNLSFSLRLQECRNIIMKSRLYFMAMAEYIAFLPMSAFVHDYDHNAPYLEHLQNTHEPFFKVIRKVYSDVKEMFGAGDSMVVDGSHPNDLGFWCMAKLIGDKLREVL